MSLVVYLGAFAAKMSYGLRNEGPKSLYEAYEIAKHIEKVSKFGISMKLNPEKRSPYESKKDGSEVSGDFQLSPTSCVSFQNTNQQVSHEVVYEPRVDAMCVNGESMPQIMSMLQDPIQDYTYEQLGYVYTLENDSLHQFEPIVPNPMVCMNEY